MAIITTFMQSAFINAAIISEFVLESGLQLHGFGLTNRTVFTGLPMIGCDGCGSWLHWLARRVGRMNNIQMHNSY